MQKIPTIKHAYLKHGKWNYERLRNDKVFDSKEKAEQYSEDQNKREMIQL
jgi:hypothetical protein